MSATSRSVRAEAPGASSTTVVDDRHTRQRRRTRRRPAHEAEAHDDGVAYQSPAGTPEALERPSLTGRRVGRGTYTYTVESGSPPPSRHDSGIPSMIPGDGARAAFCRAKDVGAQRSDDGRARIAGAAAPVELRRAGLRPVAARVSRRLERPAHSPVSHNVTGRHDDPPTRSRSTRMVMFRSPSRSSTRRVGRLGAR